MKNAIFMRNLTTCLLFFLSTLCVIAQPSNDECVNAFDISDAFEGECGVTNFNGPFDLTGATAGTNDPPEPEAVNICGVTSGNEHPGVELFGDTAEAWENSIWFTWTVPDLNGDGLPVAYTFWTSDGTFNDDCGLNPNNILGRDADTQVVIYENNCPSAASDPCDYFAASEDFLAAAPPFISGWSNLEFIPGATYYMGVDGWDAAQGEFCISVTVCGTACGDNVCSIDETYCDCEDCRVDENGNSTCTFGTIAAVEYREDDPATANDESGNYYSDDLSGNIFFCSEFISGLINENVYLAFGVKSWHNCMENSSYGNDSNISLSVGKIVGENVIEDNNDYIEDNNDGTFNVPSGKLFYIQLTPADIAEGSTTISNAVLDGLGNICEQSLTINFADYPQINNPYCELSCFAGGIDTALLEENLVVCEKEVFTLSTNGLEDLTKPCNSDDGSSYVYAWRLLTEIYGNFEYVTSWMAFGTNPTIDASVFFIDELGNLGAPNSPISPIDPSTGELRKFQIKGAALCLNSDGTVEDVCFAANEGYENSFINVTYLPAGDSGCNEDNNNSEVIPGCNDESACNFNPDANTIDGSCLYEDCNGVCGGNAVEDCNGICEGSAVVGSLCTMPEGGPYSGLEGTFVDGCVCLPNINIEYFFGCTSPTACNFNINSFVDDGSCTYPETNLDCDGNCLVDVDCEGVCGGTTVEGSPCTTAEGKEGVFIENCLCQSTDGDDNEETDGDGDNEETGEEGEVDNNGDGDTDGNDGGLARMLESYSWLQNHMDAENCNAGATITEYQYPNSNYTFLHMAEPDGSGSLYFQDGTFYCSDSPGYSCANGYSLTEVMSSWTCNNTTPAAAEENVLFDKFSWLNNYINSANCTGGNRVMEYNFGSYSFVYIEDKDGGKLYFENGTFYCSDAPGYDCRALYGLNSPTANWACENENEGQDENQQDAIFSNYPWLGTLVNTNDCINTSLIIYTTGTYEFISIENREGTSLYFQDGTFYCSDAPNYNCAALYGLNEPVNEWNCTGIIQKQATAIVNQKIAFDVDFKTYPNPSNGRFTVEFTQNNLAGLVNIISITGGLVKTIHIEANQKQIAVDLAEVAKGIYIIQLETENNTKTQRMVIR